MSASQALPADQLRWRIDETQLPFDSTREVSPRNAAESQPVAMEALRFGLSCHAPGQNIYVRGVSGSGRMKVIQGLLDEIDPPGRRRLDRCYVHNFTAPDQPRLVTLAAGRGRLFRRGIRRLAEFVEQGLGPALAAAPVKARAEAIAKSTQRDIEAITRPFEKELEAAGLALVQVQNGGVAQTAMFPVVNGEPVPPDQLRQMQREEVLDEQQVERIEASFEEYAPRFRDISQQVGERFQKGIERQQEYQQQQARELLQNVSEELRRTLHNESVDAFIDEVIDDVLENRLSGDNSELPDASIIYGVNLVSCQAAEGRSPVVVENMPTVSNLMGSIETDWVNGQPVSNYRGIRAGSLVRADGGYLVLDAHDVLTEPGAWRLLMRALRVGRAEIAPQEALSPFVNQSLKPEAMDISVRVVLIGSAQLFYQLDRVDQDFTDLFKVLADFDTELLRDDAGIGQYASLLAWLVQDEQLRHFDRGGVAAICEHGARIAARKGRMSARLGRLSDIAREASFVAGLNQHEMVTREDVEETVRRTKYRASLPSQRFQNLIDEGTIHVATQGGVAGQINGLAVIQAGPLSYGFPARITATIGAGRAGIIDIEGQSSMGGTIHTKGFHILGGLLRYLLRTEHPLTFSASIAFEQSYGGIDGDSASGAEVCCLLSALTDTPIDQGFAMTGAIDQHGRIQAIGGVNEKIEGFFDTCRAIGLSGTQGVIIPGDNAGDLMLRQDVVRACAEGQFRIFAVATVAEALGILTGRDAGVWEVQRNDYTPGSLLAEARAQARRFWQRTSANPQASAGGKDD